MSHLPRGIAPELLLSQIQNTMPYLFDSTASDRLRDFPPAKLVLSYPHPPFSSQNAPLSLTHFEYYRLCLSAHYLTCATPVPTDVDNQIRKKLWPQALPLEVALQMADLIIDSRKWDFTRVTARYSCGARGTPWESEPICGHLGEWFTVASGAYCALHQYRGSELAQAKQEQLFAEVADETLRHAEIFASLWKNRDGLGCLKASASIAHNFGDLDRVMDMWELDVGDPFRREFYKLAMNPWDEKRNLRHQGRLWVAGELYKATIQGSSMALENHRHYALRQPRALRGAPDFMITIGPFFDDWGSRAAKLLSDPLEVFETLKHGWDRQPKSLGYGRAMRGMLEIHPGLALGGMKRAAEFRSIQNLSPERFEKAWAEAALREMEDIPSRA